MFLWLVSNIKVLVTASYVLGKCRTGVFVSVFCDEWESVVQLDNEECPLDNAVSFYFLEFPHVIRVEEPKVVIYNVRDI